MLHALGHLGRPYRLGGEEPAAGFDCSGLVRYVVRAASGIDLPRRAADMIRSSVSIARDDLSPGDLLFFNTLGRPFSHVALYVGEGRFIHAPGRRGEVRIESLQIDYWRARFNGARRIESPRSNELAESEVPDAMRSALPERTDADAEAFRH